MVPIKMAKNAGGGGGRLDQINAITAQPDIFCQCEMDVGGIERLAEYST